MKNPNCRIGKITYKNTSHLSEVLPRPRNNFRKLMHNHVDKICDSFPEGIAAELIIAIGFDGSYNFGSRIDENSAYTPTFLPSMIAEILRCRLMEEISENIISGYL